MFNNLPTRAELNADLADTMEYYLEKALDAKEQVELSTDSDTNDRMTNFKALNADELDSLHCSLETLHFQLGIFLKTLAQYSDAVRSYENRADYECVDD